MKISFLSILLVFFPQSASAAKNETRHGIFASQGIAHPATQARSNPAGFFLNTQAKLQFDVLSVTTSNSTSDFQAYEASYRRGSGKQGWGTGLGLLSLGGVNIYSLYLAGGTRLGKSAAMGAEVSSNLNGATSFAPAIDVGFWLLPEKPFRLGLRVTDLNATPWGLGAGFALDLGKVLTVSVDVSSNDNPSLLDFVLLTPGLLFHFKVFSISAYYERVLRKASAAGAGIRSENYFVSLLVSLKKFDFAVSYKQRTELDNPISPTTTELGAMLRFQF